LPGAISAQSLPPDLAQFGPGIRSPYVLQYSLGVDRALRKSLTLTATYTAARGVHLYRSRDVNAPLPPLYLSRPTPPSRCWVSSNPRVDRGIIRFRPRFG